VYTPVVGLRQVHCVHHICCVRHTHRWSWVENRYTKSELCW